jgi:glycosyltransferase involved in cell wall biosynthesis
LVVWINARFLIRPVTGVERVAREVITAIVRDHLSSDGCWHCLGKTIRFCLVAPRTVVPLSSPWPELVLLQTGFFQGHIWEQFDLPRVTSGQYLLNFCNTGPVFKRLQWIFLHDAQPFALPKNFTFFLRYWYRLMFLCFARSGVGIFTNSNFSAAELERYIGIKSHRSTVAHLGADHVARFEMGISSRLEKLLDQLAGRPFVLAVSSDNPNKNFATVIKALELMGENSPACIIVGQRNVKVFAKSTLITDQIHHLGYVDDSELMALYRHATVFVYPSFYEGFGLPPLEAMWNGCPVVVSRSSALPEINGDAVLYCDPENPSSLSNAVTSLIYNVDLRQKMSISGAVRAKSFVWCKTATVILDAVGARMLVDSETQ